MARRLVAVDASSLIGLSAIDAFDLLEKLYAEIAVTSAVREEVAAGEGLAGNADLEAALAAGWIRVANAGAEGPDFPGLGAGEASTLRLVVAHRGASLVVIDEQRGRAQAKAFDIPVTGVVGVLLDAKRQGHIQAISSLLERLRSSGFRLSTALVEDVLDQADE